MRHTFEGRSVERLDLERAFVKAQEILDRDAIAPSEFADIYPDTADDEQWVADRERVFAEQSAHNPEFYEVQKTATVLEAIIHTEGELSEWFGPHATTIPSSAYDDYKNGVDEVVEFDDGEMPLSHLALAIDVTSGPNLSKKIDRIRHEIESGTLTQMKYFRTADGSVRSEKKNIPRVIIGVDVTTIRELSSLWLENNRKALAEHPVQFTLLEEMRSQLKTYRDYALQIGHTEVADVYTATLHTVVEILKAKDSNTSADMLENDTVFVSLKEVLATFVADKKAA